MWPADSVCVPSQCGVNEMVLQLQLPPRLTWPMKLPLASGSLRERGESNQRGPPPSKFTPIARSCGCARSTRKL